MKILRYLKKLLKKLIGYYPHKLPSGMTEFDAFVKKVFSIYQVEDGPSYRNAIATMIMHLPPTTDRTPLSFFGKSLKKAQANQTAYEIIQNIKKAEKEKQELEAKKAQEEQISEAVLPVDTTTA